MACGVPDGHALYFVFQPTLGLISDGTRV